MSKKLLKICKYSCMVLGAVFGLGATVFNDRIDTMNKAEKLEQLPKELLKLKEK